MVPLSANVISARMAEDREQKFCVVCAEHIFADASKCKHCDSYQGFRRHFNFSNTILSLLVALVSVLAVATPVFVSVFERDDALIDFSSATASTDSVYLLVSNRGTAPGSFNRARLYFKFTDFDESGYINLDPVNIDEIYFDARDSRLLRLIARDCFLSTEAPFNDVSEEDLERLETNNEFLVRGFYSTFGGMGGWLDVVSSNPDYLGFIANNCEKYSNLGEK